MKVRRHLPRTQHSLEALEGVGLSLRTRTLLLFLAFVLLPLAAVGVVGAAGMRLAVELTVQRAVASGLGPVSTETILQPMDRVMFAYVAVMLLVGAVATLGFRLVSHRIFHSLDDFRGAVEQIAQGDFAPWLPPPGKDEVGWLSLALGRMAESLGHMMQSIEQSGRLAVVGEMAAHMAHEVRTPLSSIKLNLQLLDRGAKAGLVPNDLQLNIDTSLAEIARLESTVNRMLEFGAPERASRERCRLHPLINDAADLLRGALDTKGVTLRLDLDAESDWILADRGRVKGVFLNLLVNARDAMPQGGEILVETQLFLGEGGRQMVAVAVSDRGAGVPVGLRDEIFHPFFTTKPEGCGIGLPAALRTLREHGGDLFLSQRPDGRVGGCFVALFPLDLSVHDGAVDLRLIEGPEASPPARSWRKPATGELRWRRVSRPESLDDEAVAGSADVPHIH
jgi:signal transduction histidine kinase